jgi:ubiquitin-conjugating enzyme E2 variant
MGARVARRVASFGTASPGLGRALQGAAIVLAPVLLAAHALDLLAQLERERVLPAAAGLVLGVLAADAATGLVHWACDTWGDERTPWLGPGLIRFFREHHHDPEAILAHDWIVVNREPAAAASAALLLLWLPPAEAALEGNLLARGFVCSFAAFAASANLIHRFAHAPRPPRVVRLAQRAGLVLSAERHARHHRAPHRSDYCIATGWLNPLLDRIGFWRRLEAVILRLSVSMRRSGTEVERR